MFSDLVVCKIFWKERRCFITSIGITLTPGLEENKIGRSVPLIWVFKTFDYLKVQNEAFKIILMLLALTIIILKEAYETSWAMLVWLSFSIKPLIDTNSAYARCSIPITDSTIINMIYRQFTHLESMITETVWLVWWPELFCKAAEEDFTSVPRRTSKRKASFEFFNWLSLLCSVNMRSNIQSVWFQLNFTRFSEHQIRQTTKYKERCAAYFQLFP